MAQVRTFIAAVFPVLLLSFIIVFVPQQALAEDSDSIAPCDPGTGDEQWGDLDRFGNELDSALSRNDPTALALLVEFPLKVNYPDGSVILLGNPQALQIHWNEVFSEKLRSGILKTSDGTVWRNVDVGIAHGVLWAEQVGCGKAKRFLIHTVNLPDAEAPPAAAAQTSFQFICETDTHRILIDSTDKKMRYRVWNKPHFPPAKPDLEIASGSMDYHGTDRCVGRTWTFNQGNITYDVGESPCTEDPNAKGTLEVTIGSNPPKIWTCY